MNRAILFLSMFFGAFAVANAQMTVSGTLLGHDGKPMIVANVILNGPSSQDPLRTIDVAADGRYSITIDSSGVWMLVFAGVNHLPHKVAIYVDKPEKIALNVRLQTYDYLDTISEVKIEGPFNKFNIRDAMPMQREPNGAFTAVVKTDADTVGYELVGITKDGHTVNGTESARYFPDWAGDYTSVVPAVNGEAKITFDPSKLIRSDKKGKIVFADPNSTEAKFASIYEDMMREERTFSDTLASYEKSGKDMRAFKYDWSAVQASLTKEMNTEKSPIVRQALLLHYLLLGAMTAKPDSSIARMAVTEIQPSSYLWSISPFLIEAALMYSKAGQAETQAYYQKVLDENPDINTCAAVAYIELVFAKQTGDTTAAAKYYALLTTTFADTPYGKAAVMRFNPASNLIVGKPVPAFSVVSMNDSTKVISNETLKGKYYLMDFWATWCGPCVGEMPNLDRAYKEFKDRNFEILSLSLDASPADVAKFRRDKWPMPWLHAFIGQNSDSKILKDFGVVSIPDPILVDPTGNIIAMGEDLRGEGLVKTLEKFLGKK